VYGMEIGAPVGIDKSYRDRHLALKGWIVRFELHHFNNLHFNNLLVCPELCEMAVVRVGVRGRLAGSAACRKSSCVRFLWNAATNKERA
jgi:hypothetical protein